MAQILSNSPSSRPIRTLLKASIMLQTIISMKDTIIMAPPTELYCFRLVRMSVRLSVVTLTLTLFIRFLSNFIYGLLLSTSRSSSNTGFVQHPITKMADQNGYNLSISAVVVTLTQSFLIGFLPNFIYALFPSTSLSSFE